MYSLCLEHCSCTALAVCFGLPGNLARPFYQPDLRGRGVAGRANDLSSEHCIPLALYVDEGIPDVQI